MIRTVLDTNVFSSSFFGGNPRKIINLWKTGQLILCVSPKIMDVYFYFLKRLGLDDKPELRELMQLFATGTNLLFAAKTPKIKIVIDDPDDDMFIECAVALKCKYLVSGDNHLLNIQKYMDVWIINPKEFLQMVNK